MSRRPWMPLYIGDYLAKTNHLNTLQHGAYLLLLMHYWTHGELPNDSAQLMAIAKMTPRQWAGNCQILAKFFDNKWRNKRADDELRKAKNISERRAYAGLKGAWKKHGKASGKVWQLPPHHTPHTNKRTAGKEGKDGSEVTNIAAASPALVNAMRQKKWLE